MNAHSSRSHSVFLISIKQENKETRKTFTGGRGSGKHLQVGGAGGRGREHLQVGGAGGNTYISVYTPGYNSRGLTSVHVFLTA